MSKLGLVVFVCSAGVLSGAVSTLAAQAVDASANSDAQGPPASQYPSFVTRWNNGISIQSIDGEYAFQIGGLIQADGRFAPDDPAHTLTDGFLLRRVRPILQGRVAKSFDYRLMPDFAGSTVVLFDAYVETKFSRAFRVRVGKDKTPVGYEQLLADYSLLFPERTLANNLIPNRDVGVQFQGAVARGRLAYVGGVFNGVTDGTSGDLDTNSAKDVVGRVTLRVGGLGVAVGASSGRQNGTLPAFRTASQQTFYSYASGATADGTRTRVAPAVFFYRGPFSAFAEYVRSAQVVNRVGIRQRLANTAWETTATFVVSGEAASDRGVTPRRQFDPANGQWGALQMAARFSALDVDPLAFQSNFAAADANGHARAIGVAAVWYPNAYVKQVIAVERTTFERNASGRRGPEHAIIFRVQFNLQPAL